MLNNMKETKFDRAKIGNIVRIYRRIRSDGGHIYEVNRSAKIVDKYENFIIVEYLPDLDGKKKGGYKESFTRFDFNKMKIDLLV